MRSISSSVMFSIVFALTLTGCGSSGGEGSVEVGITAQALQTVAPPSGGSDAASQRHLVLSVTEVNVHVAATGGDRANDESAPGEDPGGSGWITVFRGETDLDLFDATSTEELLGSLTVPAGKVTQVRLVLAGAKLVDGSTTLPVTCPSCSKSGLKIVTEGKVEVAAGETLHLALDVDQTRSLTKDESGYRLAPVIKITGANGN